ncbi:hypothetical protein DM860_001826 [Cuscuta australis]|uniref:Uncharacterized protein n=1 Tax=Cuscuta australis TaxID=267555 RepID=A0A328EDE2_9ASTE|nr:hypothetical protein DM860_001826 [Cuscuta australis]
MRTVLEVEPPSPLRYLIGAAIMMAGVVLPLGYMMFRNKRAPSSAYSKQTIQKLYSVGSGNGSYVMALPQHVPLAKWRGIGSRRVRTTFGLNGAP